MGGEQKAERKKETDTEGQRDELGGNCESRPPLGYGVPEVNIFVGTCLYKQFDYKYVTKFFILCVE